MCLLSGGTTLHIFGRTVERLEAVICENVGFLRSDTNRFAWFVGCGSLSVRDVCFSLSRVGALAWVAVGFAKGLIQSAFRRHWHAGVRRMGGFGWRSVRLSHTLLLTLLIASPGSLSG